MPILLCGGCEHQGCGQGCCWHRAGALQDVFSSSSEKQRSVSQLSPLGGWLVSRGYFLTRPAAAKSEPRVPEWSGETCLCGQL